MQEKDIRRKLNQELEEMAPDLLSAICAQPIEPVKSEKELFGKNKPLFKEEKKIGKHLWVPALAAIAACIAIAIFLTFQFGLNPQQTLPQSQMAFDITIDVNPSICIEVNEDGTVHGVRAENKDAKKIVRQVNEKLEKGTDYNRAVELVISKLRKNGYLKKEKNAMLVSVISDDKEAGKETLADIKNSTKKYQKKKGIKCTTVYQNCVKDDKIKEVAEKNNVSVGKAAFCMKIAENEKTSVKKMCKKSIYTLVEKAKEDGSVSNEEIFIDDVEQVLETESGNIESLTEEATETMEETMNPEETTIEPESELETAVDEPENDNQENYITEQTIN